MDPLEIDRIFRLVDRAVWVVTSSAAGRRSGLVATFVSQTSIDPQTPLVLAGIAHSHFTGKLISQSGALVAHLLRPDQAAIALPFALYSGRDHDKFAGLATTAAETGSPILNDCLAWLDCRVLTHFDLGDRRLVLASVVAGRALGDGPPLTESQLIAHASPEQRATLKSQYQADVELHRSDTARWLAAVALGSRRTP